MPTIVKWSLTRALEFLAGIIPDATPGETARFLDSLVKAQTLTPAEHAKYKEKTR